MCRPRVPRPFCQEHSSPSTRVRWRESAAPPPCTYVLSCPPLGGPMMHCMRGGTGARQWRSDRFLCPDLSVFAHMLHVQMAGDEAVNRRSAMAAAAGMYRVCVFDGVCVCERTRTHLPGKIEAHTNMHAHIHAYIRMNRNTYLHTHTYILTHTHTHTHTYSPGVCAAATRSRARSKVSRATLSSNCTPIRCAPAVYTNAYAPAVYTNEFEVRTN